jgi:uncharacterized membrane protein YuzA (DUF378 family)
MFFVLKITNSFKRRKMRALGMAIGLVQSVAALLIGLHFMNIDLMAHLSSSSLAVAVKPLQIVFGLAGLYGFYGLFTCNKSC